MGWMWILATYSSLSPKHLLSCLSHSTQPYKVNPLSMLSPWVMMLEQNGQDLQKICCFQSLIHVWLFVISWTASLQASLSFTISRSLLKLMSIELVMPSYNLILYWPLFLLPSVFLRIRVFSNESALCIRWPKYWSFSFGIGPSNEYPRSISFWIGWFDLLAVQDCAPKIIQLLSSRMMILTQSLHSKEECLFQEP